ncbi:MAG TPA: GxxExxY protein, partial [Candidatus Wallbacteria bacterium]|nr:GxxExxY protein [Candidatus Wallbacteria bacterium]
INGGGRIFREYGLGMKRMDLLVEFGKDRFAIELKVKRNPNTEKEGIKQLEEYMNRSGAAEGHLVIFNVLEKSWKKRIFTKKQKNAITVWGM